SGMPSFSEDLPPGGAEQITSYLMSMTDEQIPMRYAVAAVPKPEPKFSSAAERGKHVYQKYGCTGCHGLEAKQGRTNFNATGPGQEDPATDMMKGEEPTLRKTVGNFTRDELRAKIQNGVPASGVAKFNPNGPTPPLYMPPWKEKIKGQELEDLISYLLSIAEKDESF
ncbi:MAG: c-type cytochrome, partial [Elusimicrobia bacterium]|nr:c-type cytochrome [Elusimicrobiota bacterium]